MFAKTLHKCKALSDNVQNASTMIVTVMLHHNWKGLMEGIWNLILKELYEIWAATLNWLVVTIVMWKTVLHCSKIESIQNTDFRYIEASVWKILFTYIHQQKKNMTKVFVILGHLHIIKSFLLILGYWLMMSLFFLDPVRSWEETPVWWLWLHSSWCKCRTTQESESWIPWFPRVWELLWRWWRLPVQV